MATRWQQRVREYRGRVTFWPVLAVVILTVIQQGRIEPTLFGWTRAQGAQVGLAGLAAFVAVVVVARLVTGGRAIGLMGTILVWLLASLARIAGFTLGAVRLDLDSAATLGQQRALFITTFAFSLLVSFLESTQSAHRRVLTQLRGEQTALEQRVADDSAELAIARANVADAVEHQMQPVREVCRMIVAQEIPRASDVSARQLLREQVEEVLRPASQELLTELSTTADRATMEPPASPTAGDRLAIFARRMGRREAFRPLWPIVAVALIAPVILTSVPQLPDPWLSVLAGLGATAISVVGVWLLWRAGARPRHEVSWGWLAVLAAYLIAGFITGALIRLTPWATDRGSVAFFGALIVVFGMIGTAYYVVRGAQTDTERELAEALAAQAELDARLRREVWFERRRLASVLHGRVQSRLIAAATHLSEDAHDPGSVDEVRAHINEALVALNSLRTSREGVVADPMAALAEIAAVWAPTMSVDLQVRAQDLDGWSPATIAAMCDIVTEGVLNARKHGEAEHVVVSVLRDGDALRVQIADDGAGLVADFTPGLGSRFLDSVASSWTRSTINSRGTSLVADLRETPTTV